MWKKEKMYKIISGKFEVPGLKNTISTTTTDDDDDYNNNYRTTTTTTIISIVFIETMREKLTLEYWVFEKKNQQGCPELIRTKFSPA